LVHSRFTFRLRLLDKATLSRSRVSHSFNESTPCHEGRRSEAASWLVTKSLSRLRLVLEVIRCCSMTLNTVFAQMHTYCVRLSPSLCLGLVCAPDVLPWRRTFHHMERIAPWVSPKSRLMSLPTRALVCYLIGRNGRSQIIVAARSGMAGGWRWPGSR